MFKKILLILVMTTVMGCGTAKPKIITTRSGYAKQKSVAAPARKRSKARPAKPAPREQNVRGTEMIESTSKTLVTNDVIADYVSQFKDIAMSNMRNYGIPASVILAQGILESGAGKGDLAISANNHFGIKCHKDWTGESVRHDDDADQECFRKYNDPSESFRDHALFLTGRSRYANLFALPKGDYQAWARGLSADGYATDPKYPEKLISYIERYGLHQYDAQVLGTAYTPIEKKNTGIVSSESVGSTLYEVQKGDTFYSISKKFNLMIDELKQINNLIDNTLSIGQKLRVK